MLFEAAHIGLGVECNRVVEFCHQSVENDTDAFCVIHQLTLTHIAILFAVRESYGGVVSCRATSMNESP